MEPLTHTYTMLYRMLRTIFLAIAIFGVIGVFGPIIERGMVVGSLWIGKLSQSIRLAVKDAIKEALSEAQTAPAVAEPPTRSPRTTQEL